MKILVCSVLIFALAGAAPPALAGECQGASNPDPPDGSGVGLPVWADSIYMMLDYSPCANAVSHTGYFSDNRQDVTNRDPAHCLGDTPPWPAMDENAFVVGYDDPAIPEFARAPLVPGTTYYWCVDTFDGEQDIAGPTWSFTLIDSRAWGPSPEDGEQWVPNDGTMTWNLGDVDDTGKALSYNVYIGTDEAAVAGIAAGDTAAAMYMGNVAEASYEYDDLESEVEYFWRVDTKLQLTRPPFTPTYYTGNVWSFEAGGCCIGGILREWWTGIPGDSISDLTNDPNYPNNPDGRDILSTFEVQPDIMDNYGSRLHGWLLVTRTGDYTFLIDASDAGELWLSNDPYPANASLIAYILAGPRPWGPDPDPHQISDPITLEAGQTHYISALMKAATGRDEIAVAWQGPDTGGVPEVITGRHLIPYIPVFAEDPYPPDGATDIPTAPTLRWTPGILAAESNGSIMYYSEDADAVTNRTAPSATVTDPCFVLPMTLELGSTFYWAVDTVNGIEIWPGDLWNFTVRNWLSVDDVEPYTHWTIPGDNIFDTWRDGWGCPTNGNNGTGSEVTENTDMTYVLGGAQSMKYDFDNDGWGLCLGIPEPVRKALYSKIEAQTSDIASGIGSEWVTAGVRALSLPFYGQAENDITEPLWVQLQDSTKGYGQKVFYGDYPGEDINDMNEPEWHEWLIDLADFAVDLNDVVSIAIGIGNEDAQTPGGSGTLYFDEMRLYTPRCIPQRRTTAFAELDQAPEGDPDCKIDGQDLKTMAQNWLEPPNTPNLKDYAELADNWLKTETWPF